MSKPLNPCTFSSHSKTGKSIHFLILVLIFCIPAVVFSQNRKDLEEKRQRLLHDIKTTSNLLNKTTQKREATLDRYVVLQKQINQREELIANLTEAVADSDSSISRNQAVIGSLSGDVEKMKSDYGRTVRAAFRRKQTTNPLLFLLNAESLNQAFRRLLFLRKYDESRRKQADAIAFTQKMLARKLLSLEDIRQQKQQLLGQATGQQQTLSFELENKELLLKTLETDQDRLQTDLVSKEKAHEQLNLAIEKIIREEVAKRVAEARKPKKEPAPTASPPAEKPKPLTTRPGEKPTSSPALSAPKETISEADDAQTADFRKLKGKLPWPVESGFISKKYGPQPHPTLKNITITNNGIDIRTESGEQARAVAAGQVAGVQFVPGHDNLVIVQHGDFYSVYSNLSEVWVQKGQSVTSRQNLGRVAVNALTEASELHFEIWQEKERVNPASWLKK